MIVGLVHPSAVGNQQRHNVEMPAHTARNEGSDAVYVGLVHGIDQTASFLSFQPLNQSANGGEVTGFAGVGKAAKEIVARRHSRGNLEAGGVARRVWSPAKKAEGRR